MILTIKRKYMNKTLTQLSEIAQVDIFMNWRSGHQRLDIQSPTTSHQVTSNRASGHKRVDQPLDIWPPNDYIWRRSLIHLCMALQSVFELLNLELVMQIIYLSVGFQLPLHLSHNANLLVRFLTYDKTTQNCKYVNVCVPADIPKLYQP